MIFNTEDTEVYRATTGESFYRKSFVPSCLRVRKIGIEKNLCASVALCETTEQCSYNAARFTQSHRVTEAHRAMTGDFFLENLSCLRARKNKKSFVPLCLRVRKIGVKKNLRVLCVTSVTSVLEKGATLFYKKESAA